MLSSVVVAFEVYGDGPVATDCGSLSLACGTSSCCNSGEGLQRAPRWRRRAAAEREEDDEEERDIYGERAQWHTLLSFLIDQTPALLSLAPPPPCNFHLFISRVLPPSHIGQFMTNSRCPLRRSPNTTRLISFCIFFGPANGKFHSKKK